MTEYKMDLSCDEKNTVGAIELRQGTKNADTFIARITENNELKLLNGYQVFFNARVKNTTIARDVVKNVDYGNSTVSYTLHESFYQQTGEIEGYFSFEKNDGKIVDDEAGFTFKVIKGVCTDIQQGNYIYDFEQLKEAIEEIIANEDLTSLIKAQDVLDMRIKEVETNVNARMDKLDINVTNTLNRIKNSVDAEIKKLSDDISKHKKNVENPHKVTAAQVGSHTTDEIKKILEEYQKKDGLSYGEKLWTGGLLMIDTHKVTPSKKLNQCRNGWLLTWVRYNPKTTQSDYSYAVHVFVSKYNLGTRIELMPHAGENAYSKKMLNITNDFIQGNVANGNGAIPENAAFRMVMVTVTSW